MPREGLCVTVRAFNCVVEAFKDNYEHPDREDSVRLLRQYAKAQAELVAVASPSALATAPASSKPKLLPAWR